MLSALTCFSEKLIGIRSHHFGTDRITPHHDRLRALRVNCILSRFAAELSSPSFLGIRKSETAKPCPLRQIKEIQPALHGDYRVVLREGTQRLLSRRLYGLPDEFAGGA